MNISKLVQRLEEIENHTKGEGVELINSLIEELIEIDLRLEKGFKEHLSKQKDDFLDKLFKDGIEDGIIGEA
tara:strand:+ start:383 stop:598 length:216 start_codon:yes stop_codon:yes gene_type:complete